MDQATLQSLLASLIATWENEVVEFKRAENDYDTNKIGEYFSALSNEANLRNVERAWLVFGVDNKTRSVVGSDYRQDHERLHSLKMQIAAETEPSIPFATFTSCRLHKGALCCSRYPPLPWACQLAGRGITTPVRARA